MGADGTSKASIPQHQCLVLRDVTSQQVPNSPFLDTGPHISKDPGVRRLKILYVEPEFQGGTFLMWSEASGISVDYILQTLAVLRLVLLSHNLPGVGLIWNREDVGAPGIPTVGCGDTLREEC